MSLDRNRFVTYTSTAADTGPIDKDSCGDCSLVTLIVVSEGVSEGVSGEPTTNMLRIFKPMLVYVCVHIRHGLYLNALINNINSFSCTAVQRKNIPEHIY